MHDSPFQQLTEGHLNVMYVASLHAPDMPDETSIIIRVPAEVNKAIIDRDNERMCIRLLNHLGLSSPLLAEFKNGYCLGYLPGESFPRNLAGADTVFHKKKKISWYVDQSVKSMGRICEVCLRVRRV
jgi:hypothetical protein